MIASELKLYNFRRFRSVDGAPGLHISFHKGHNDLIGENDSGKTAVIDALKLVLLTESNDFIRPVEEDFYKPADGEPVPEFKIDCTLAEFTPTIIISRHLSPMPLRYSLLVSAAIAIVLCRVFGSEWINKVINGYFSIVTDIITGKGISNQRHWLVVVVRLSLVIFAGVIVAAPLISMGLR